MASLQRQSHDWDLQYREPKDVWSTLQDQGVDLERAYCLDFQFIPGTGLADKVAFAAALSSANFKVKFYDGDPTVEASVPGILLTLEEIWRHEKRATQIALRFGFAPDGWGFLNDATG